MEARLKRTPPTSLFDPVAVHLFEGYRRAHDDVHGRHVGRRGPERESDEVLLANPCVELLRVAQ